MNAPHTTPQKRKNPLFLKKPSLTIRDGHETKEFTELLNNNTRERLTRFRLINLWNFMSLPVKWSRYRRTF